MSKGNKYQLIADPDDGTTPIPNLLLEALAIARLTGTDKGITLYLIRKTLGWMKEGKRIEEAEVSYRQIAKYMDTHEKTVFNSLSKLIDNKVLIRRFLGPGKGYYYRVNPNINEWDDSCINKNSLKEIAGVVIDYRGSNSLQGEKEIAGGETDYTGSNSLQGWKENAPLVAQKTPALVAQSAPAPLASNSGVEINILNKYIKKEGDRYLFNTGEILGEVTDFDEKKADTIWQQVLEKVKPQVARLNYQTWLSNTKGIGCNNNKLIIYVPNQQIAEHLIRNQISIIEKTLIEVTKKKFSVYFI